LVGHAYNVGASYQYYHLDSLSVAASFDALVDRFGKARVVRAIKSRAGARIEIPTEIPTPAEVAP
jgi:hypothetical protein